MLLVVELDLLLFLLQGMPASSAYGNAGNSDTAASYCFDAALTDGNSLNSVLLHFLLLMILVKLMLL
jgi:hypothetical protein